MIIDFIKKFELPHLSTYKRRWVRRVMIVVTMPQEIARAIYHTFSAAKACWNWGDTPPAP
jgi:hypothetical protein